MGDTPDGPSTGTRWPVAIHWFLPTGGDSREVVPADCGRLVPPFDVPALAAALLDLYADEDLLVAMGVAGRAFAGGHDWDVLARRQADVYRSTVASPRSDHPPRRRRDLIERARP